ncbi:hypothetical protein ACL02U_11830 [Streptomyces sp. MS06]|uniref:hypothetical protein n=1 Tax=Streptomyces sp. MS06 TaxID=3385974 RepID=UPI0039A3573D
MTLTEYLPRLGALDRRPKLARKHRAADEIERQRVLRAGAELLIKGLQQQLADQAADHAATVSRIDARHAATVRELERQVAELQRRLRVGALAEAAAARTQELPIVRVMPLPQAAAAGLLKPVTDPGHTGGTPPQSAA